MQVFEIKPEGAGWRLVVEGDSGGVDFPSLAKAERRARWLAVRQEVRGAAAEIRVLNEAGALVGAWRGERYTLGAAIRLELWMDANAA